MDPVEFLFSLERFGIKFGLDNITRLASALGQPHTAYPTVHIAGTNGKGSVCAMVDAALGAAGWRTGRYTSPHIVHVEERFAIDRVPVSPARLRDVAATVQTTVGRLIDDGTLAHLPTFFEATTATAFELFRREAVDVGIIEVGLGGRFDSTNIIAPVAGAITTIDRDHETYLGHTIAAIASEKAGIIKPGMVVVSGETKIEAVDVIARASRERGAVLVAAAEDVHLHARFDAGRAVLDLETPRRRYPPIRLGLRGRYQVTNALVAVRLLEHLDRLGRPIPPEAIVTGLATAVWPGRLDLRDLGAGRRLLLDAAHNPAGAAALAEYILEAVPGGIPLVFAAMRDKDLDGMFRALLPAVTHLVLTRPATSRAADPETLASSARRLGSGCQVEVVTEPLAAVDRALTYGPLVGVAGSIFLVGDVLGGLEAAGPLPQVA
jgi:dihydrofolate synthase / folylpolyglutamate synthase